MVTYYGNLGSTKKDCLKTHPSTKLFFIDILFFSVLFKLHYAYSFSLIEKGIIGANKKIFNNI